LSAERTKVCANPDCHARGNAQLWSAFYAKTKWEDGTMRQPHSRCKECQHTEYRRRRAADPEAYRGYRRDYYLRHLDVELSRCKEYRDQVATDPEAHAAHLERRRRRHREQNSVPPERWRFEKGRKVSHHTGESLSAEPFALWLRRLLAGMDGDLPGLAVATGVSVETLRRVLNGRVRSVDLGTVEAALCAVGSRTLGDLYPALVLSTRSE
jgi:hypothetical protein